jgi:hypothetical protein
VGWHLSSSLRTFVARLIVPFSSSELDLRATAHIQRRGQTPRRAYAGIYFRYCSLPTMDPAAPTDPWRGPHRRAGREGDLLRLREMITLANQSKSFVVNHSVISHQPLEGKLPDQLLPAGPPAGRQRRGSAEGCQPSASRGSPPPTWRGGAR